MQYKSNLLTLLFYKNGAISSDSAPSDTTKLWLDTSVEPNVLKYHDGSDWVMVNDQSADYKALLEVTSKEINAEVSKKVGQDEIISRINQTAEAIRILASKIQLEGLVTANNYFKINLDGSIEAINGKFSGTLDSPTINGGNINGVNIKTEKDVYIGNNLYINSEIDKEGHRKIIFKSPDYPDEEVVLYYDPNTCSFHIESAGEVYLKGSSGTFGSMVGSTFISGSHNVNLNAENDVVINPQNAFKGSKAYQQTSDKRLKKVVSLMNEKMYRVWKNINPVIFEWNELNLGNDKKQFGIIAQEAIAAFESEELDYNDYGLFGSIELDGREYFTISYDNYNMMSANALKFAIKEIEEIKKALI